MNNTQAKPQESLGIEVLFFFKKQRKEQSHSVWNEFRKQQSELLGNAHPVDLVSSHLYKRV